MLNRSATNAGKPQEISQALSQSYPQRSSQPIWLTTNDVQPMDSTGFCFESGQPGLKACSNCKRVLQPEMVMTQHEKVNLGDSYY